MRALQGKENGVSLRLFLRDGAECLGAAFKFKPLTKLFAALRKRFKLGAARCKSLAALRSIGIGGL